MSYNIRPETSIRKRFASSFISFLPHHSPEYQWNKANTAEPQAAKNIGCLQLPAFGNIEDYWHTVDEHLKENPALNLLVLWDPEFPNPPSDARITQAGKASQMLNCPVVFGSTVYLPDGTTLRPDGPLSDGKAPCGDELGSSTEHTPDVPGLVQH